MSISHQLFKFLAFLCLACLGMGFGLGNAYADRIAVIGTGNVGGALGPKFAALGHQIVYGSRSPGREDVVALVKKTGEGASVEVPAAAVKDADIVLLAIPGLMVEEITRSLGKLDGKIIIDPTNPLMGWDKGNIQLREGPSNTATIQKTAPGALVVKAFSSLNYKQMIHPEKSGGPISILLAGNDAGAKAKVAELVTGVGLEPIDLGSLEAATFIEGMSVLLLNNRIQGRERFEFHLRKE